VVLGIVLVTVVHLCAVCLYRMYYCCYFTGTVASSLLCISLSDKLYLYVSAVSRKRRKIPRNKISADARYRYLHCNKVGLNLNTV
jgi:hypothetical protein